MGLILFFLASGVWSGTRKGSLILLAEGSSSFIRNGTTVIFGLSIALKTLFAMSYVEKPMSATNPFRVNMSIWNKLVSVFQFDALLVLVPLLDSSAFSCANRTQPPQDDRSSTWTGFPSLDSTMEGRTGISSFSIPADTGSRKKKLCAPSENYLHSLSRPYNITVACEYLWGGSRYQTHSSKKY